MKILTIIATYNGSKWINKCITSLLESDCKTDIFIIDNASSDDTVAVLESYNTIKIHRNIENLGFGQANNIGLQYSLENNYDYVFLLNQDTWIEKNTISVLLDVAEQNNEYGILSPLHYFSDQKSLEYNFSVQLSPWFCKDIISDFVTKSQKEMKAIYSLNFINAAAWFIPIKTLEVVGGFDPLFFHYGEDNNYCNRVTYHNLKVGIVPKVKIYHDCNDFNNKRRKGLDEELRKFELDFKTSYANINIDISKQEMLVLVFKKLLFSLWLVFCFNFFEARKYLLSAKIILKNCSKIIESRNRNFISRPNYLAIDDKILR